MTASEKLRELYEAASQYITHDNIGQQAVRDANHFVDTMVDVAPLLISVVEAAEAAPSQVCYNAEVGWGQCEGITDRGEWERVACSACRLRDALTALRDALEGGDE